MIDYLNNLVATEWQTWWPAWRAKPQPTLNWVMLTNGGSALHDNVVFLGVPLGARAPILVAKTCRWPAHNETIRQEFQQLTAVWQQLGKNAQDQIPRPLHLGEAGQHAILVTDYFTGQEMTGLLRRWVGDVNETFLFETAFQRVARWLRGLHEQTAVKPATQHVANACANCDPFSHYADLFSEMFALNPNEQACLNELVNKKAASEQNASQQILQHGDFWPGNILLRPPNDQLALIDWQFSRWTYNASYDLYFLPLASGVALVRHPETAVRAQKIVQQLRHWQQTWLPTYFDTYGQPTDYALLPPKAGFLTCCIEAAARPMDTFGVQQDDAPLWRAIFGELLVE
ncbi:MAG: aminoglycoside phosphotransferase family protein [Chloroflexota bacterium]